MALLNGLAERAPWQSAARPMLLAAGFDIRKGLPNTLKHARKLKNTEEHEEILTRLLTEHSVAGEKVLQFVKVNKKERDVVLGWTRGRRRSSRDLGAVFPGQLEPIAAEAYTKDAPVPCGYEELAEGTAALYSAVRIHLERVPIPASELKPDAARNYQKIIGIKRTLHQTSEAIWIPSEGDFICLAVDLPRGYPKAFAEASQQFLTAKLKKVLGRSLKLYNLWHAVDGLYEQKGDGKLVDYGFSVGGRSVNHHKMRRNGECLREAIYDAAGAAAVGNDLDLFKVALRWKVRHDDGTDSEPELLLPGTAAHINQTNPAIEQVVLRDARTSTDLQFVVDKLMPHAT